MSDEALVAACAIGDRVALGALFDRHHQAVYAFLSRAFPHSSSEIDDLVQKTFIQIWRSARKFRSRSKVRSWIFGVGLNVARNHARGEGRRRRSLNGLASEMEASSATPPDKVAEERILVDRMSIALASLKDDLRVAFVLCEIEGIAGTEAARVLGVRPGTLWRRVHEARQALRQALLGVT